MGCFNMVHQCKVKKCTLLFSLYQHKTLWTAKLSSPKKLIMLICISGCYILVVNLLGCKLCNYHRREAENTITIVFFAQYRNVACEQTHLLNCKFSLSTPSLNFFNFSINCISLLNKFLAYALSICTHQGCWKYYSIFLVTVAIWVRMTLSAKQN